MEHTTLLSCRLGRTMIQMSDCIGFRFEKERYTPYTRLTGQWYLPYETDLNELVTVQFAIDGKVIHFGFPVSAEIIKKDGRSVLKLISNGYSAALTTNQCPDGLITDVDLTTLVKSVSFSLPNVTYQQNTPVANYVNYYDGTSLWEGIVCYSLRVGGKHYPYISGTNLVRIEPPEDKNTLVIPSSELISQSYNTDYTRLVSMITMSDIDGTPGVYVRTNTAAPQRSIVKCREISFDRQWIMSPDDGLKYKLNYAAREMAADSFTFPGFHNVDIIDRLTVDGAGFNGEVDRLVITGDPTRGICTSIWCYHDRYCN